MSNPNAEVKVTWKGWLSLIVLIVLLSGVFQNSTGPLKAFDFNNLGGSFGKIYENLTFAGKGGTGAREGFILGLTLIPAVMLFTGLLAVFEELGAFQASMKLFQPLLKPLLGIPGVAGIAFVSSFTSSDAAAIMTKELTEEGYLTDDERTIFVAYQYAASAVINNTISGGAPLLAISPLAFGPIFAIQVVCKIFGANIVRLVIYLSNKKKKEAI
jgi:nucleoside recognition membrane protein YjiH